MPRKFFLYTALFILLVGQLVYAYSDNDAASLNIAQGESPGFAKRDLRFISVDELAEKIQAKIDGKMFFHLVDLRLEADYAREHLPGAMNIPLKKLPFVAEQIMSPEDEIIFYGYSRNDRASVNAVVLLVNKGFEQVFMFEGGMIGWKEALK